MSAYILVTILNSKGNVRSRMIDTDRIILVEEEDDKTALICITEEINIKCLEMFTEVLRGIKSSKKVYNCERVTQNNITLLPPKIC